MGEGTDGYFRMQALVQIEGSFAGSFFGARPSSPWYVQGAVTAGASSAAVRPGYACIHDRVLLGAVLAASVDACTHRLLVMCVRLPVERSASSLLSAADAGASPSWCLLTEMRHEKGRSNSVMIAIDEDGCIC